MVMQILIRGRVISVRQARTENDSVRVWDALFPGQIHGPTRLTHAQLRKLGPGLHDIRT